MDMGSYEETRLPRDDWAKYLKEGAICYLVFYQSKVSTAQHSTNNNSYSIWQPQLDRAPSGGNRLAGALLLLLACASCSDLGCDCSAWEGHMHACCTSCPHSPWYCRSMACPGL
jgi:hypothetical protein